MSFKVVKKYYESQKAPVVGTKILVWEGIYDGLSRAWHLAELDDNNNIVKENYNPENEKVWKSKIEKWKQGQVQSKIDKAKFAEKEAV